MLAVSPYSFPAEVGLPLEKAAVILRDFPGAPILRTGGVLRVGPGDALGRGGQIVAHLRDLPGTQLPQVSQALQQVSQLGQLATAFSGVAAVTGVLNLAVSVAGFAIMNKKLNQLSGELHDLRALVERQMDRVDGKLDVLNDRLVDLGLLVYAVKGDTAVLRSDLAEVARLLDADRLARLAPILTRLENGEYAGKTHLADQAVDSLRELQWFFETAITQQPAQEVSTRLVRDLAYFQAWATAIAVEARLARLAGNTAQAARTVEAGLARFAPTARSYASVLMGEAPATLLIPRMSTYVRPADVIRWVSFVRGQDLVPTEVLPLLTSERDEFLRARGTTPARYFDDADTQALQVRAAATERLIGTVERLDTYLLELQLCERESRPMDHWENLSFAEPATSGVYALPVKNAA